MSSRRLMLAVVLIAFASLCQQASARIGETPEQCQVRYGNGKQEGVIKDGVTKILYKKSGFDITVSFYDGKAEQIVFRKSEEDNFGISAPISDNEIQSILKQNSGGKEWKTCMGLICESWQTEDGQLFASYYSMHHLLVIWTADQKARTDAETKAKEDKKLEGF